MRSGFILFAAIMVLAPSCKKKDGDRGALTAEAKPNLIVRAHAGRDASPRPDAVSDAQMAMAKGAPFVPLAQGKTLRLRGLQTVPLEVTVPPKVQFRMEGPGEDFGAEAHLEGPDNVHIIISLEEEVLSLSAQRELLGKMPPPARPASVLRAQELSPGFVIIYERSESEANSEFGAIVSLPDLGVRCKTLFGKSLSEAELGAAVCLSIRPAKRPVIDLAALPPLTPLAKGKAVRIEGLKTVPLAIIVPPKFKYRLSPYVGPVGPDAYFEGPREMSITVGPIKEGKFPMENGKFLSLAEQQKELLAVIPSATVVRADQTPEGFLLIALHASGIGDERYSVIVSRPDLKVLCNGSSLARLADAELLASACLSLRPATSEDR